MSIVKAYDVSHVRFGVPDLDVMQTFLTDFGLLEVARDDNRLFMRGYEGGAFAHVCELRTEPVFLGFGLLLNSEDDLARLAAHDCVPIQPLDAPGGGKVVRLYDPDGYMVEAIVAQATEIPSSPPQSDPWNHGGNYPRLSATRRVNQGSSHVRRLGHVVLSVSDFRRSERWYKDRFGFLTSDEVQAAPDVAVAAFMRADRGEVPCDHHTLLLIQLPAPPGFMHAAFEVRDLDDLMVGHDHLKAGGYHHRWGIGRHFLGSQVFDYWLDPYGNEIEHWTDGDQFMAADGGGTSSVEQLMDTQWGMKMPLLDHPAELQTA